MKTNVRKQQALSIKSKIDIIKAVDLGKFSKTAICKEFGIPNSTLSTILKNKEKIISNENNEFQLNRQRMRTPKHVDIENALIIWFKQCRSQNIPISGALIMEKADMYASEMGIEFLANNGWLERFKKRNEIVYKSVCGESSQVSQVMISEWLTDTLPSILQNYDPKNIFNADETGIFYHCLPNKTYAFKNEQCSGGKKSKERLTVLIGCNSDGSEKLPILVIGRYLKPRCFKFVTKLPVEYRANRKAWMVSTIFTEWLLKLDKKFLFEKREVAMIIDNCSAHIRINLKAIKLIFLPSNTTSVLQPCDQGIIQNFKIFYRRQLLRKYLAAFQAKEEFTINILDALHMLRTAWSLVTPETIENCFKHSGFSKVITQTKVCEYDIKIESKFNEMFEQATSILNCSVSLVDYLKIDSNVYTSQVLSDNEIIELVKSGNTDEISDGSEDETIQIETIPSTLDIRKMLSGIRRFLDKKSNGEMSQNIDKIEEFVENRLISSLIQKSITDYF